MTQQPPPTQSTRKTIGLVVRNVPLDLHRLLRIRAAENKRTLAQEHLAVLEQALRPARTQ